MISARNSVLVLVTAPDLKTARSLARAVLRAKLVACANLLPGIESHYWWQGKVEAGREVLLMMKTLRDRLPALEAMVLRLHPYDTPEFLVVALESGAPRYLDWLSASVGGRAKRPRRSLTKRG
jgi:uncharacterized protein involved in tolerance to divalent cations